MGLDVFQDTWFPYLCLMVLSLLLLAARRDRGRLYTLDKEIAACRSELLIIRLALESKVQQLNYELETKYKQETESELLSLKRQLESHSAAIIALSGALKRVPDDSYVPRGTGCWPTNELPGQEEE